jgi:hypothetical protein
MTKMLYKCASTINKWRRNDPVRTGFGAKRPGTLKVLSCITPLLVHFVYFRVGLNKYNKEMFFGQYSTVDDFVDNA